LTQKGVGLGRGRIPNTRKQREKKKLDKQEKEDP